MKNGTIVYENGLFCVKTEGKGFAVYKNQGMNPPRLAVFDSDDPGTINYAELVCDKYANQLANGKK